MKDTQPYCILHQYLSYCMPEGGPNRTENKACMHHLESTKNFPYDSANARPHQLHWETGRQKLLPHAKNTVRWLFLLPYTYAANSLIEYGCYGDRKWAHVLASRKRRRSYPSQVVLRGNHFISSHVTWLQGYMYYNSTCTHQATSGCSVGVSLETM